MSTVKLKSGLLLKQGQVVQSWKERLFTLTRSPAHSYLCYYDPDDKKLKGKIDVASIARVEPLPSRGAFRLKCGERDYVLVCVSDDDRKAWIDAIQSCMYGPSLVSQYMSSAVAMRNAGKIGDGELEYVRQFLTSGRESDVDNALGLLSSAEKHAKQQQRASNQVELLLLQFKYATSEQQLLSVMSGLQRCFEGEDTNASVQDRLIEIAMAQYAGANDDAVDNGHGGTASSRLGNTGVGADHLPPHATAHQASSLTHRWTGRVQQEFGLVLHAIALHNYQKQQPAVEEGGTPVGDADKAALVSATPHHGDSNGTNSASPAKAEPTFQAVLDWAASNNQDGASDSTITPDRNTESKSNSLILPTSRPAGDGRQGSGGQTDTAAGVSVAAPIAAERVHTIVHADAASLIPNSSADSTDALAMFREDKTFLEDYVIGGKLGEGAYSTVYRATHSQTGEPVAVKIAHKHKLSSVEAKRLVDEITLMAELDHDNIVRLRAFYEDAASFYIISELMLGGELFDRIVHKSHYSEREARDIVRTLAGALAAMHDRGIVHRDLKPENILLSSTDETTGIVKIADLGFARRVPSNGLRTSCGTPSYVSPDVLLGRKYDQKVDCWSLGVIFFILLCGYAPFAARSQAELFRLIVSGRFYFDSPFWDKVSDEAKDLIKKLLTVDPSKRLSAHDVLKHKWFEGSVSNVELGSALSQMRRFQNSRKRVLFFGELLKQGNWVKNFKRRLFVLTGDALEYFEPLLFVSAEESEQWRSISAKSMALQTLTVAQLVPAETPSRGLIVLRDISAVTVAEGSDTVSAVAAAGTFAMNFLSSAISTLTLGAVGNDPLEIPLGAESATSTAQAGASSNGSGTNASSLGSGSDTVAATLRSPANRSAHLTKLQTTDTTAVSGARSAAPARPNTEAETAVLGNSSRRVHASPTTASGASATAPFFPSLSPRGALVSASPLLMPAAQSPSGKAAAGQNAAAGATGDVNDSPQSLGRTRYWFRISTTSGRDYALAADSEAERSEWIRALTFAMQHGDLMRRAAAAMTGEKVTEAVHLIKLAQEWQTLMKDGNTVGTAAAFTEAEDRNALMKADTSAAIQRARGGSTNTLPSGQPQPRTSRTAGETHVEQSGSATGHSQTAAITGTGTGTSALAADGKRASASVASGQGRHTLIQSKVTAAQRAARLLRKEQVSPILVSPANAPSATATFRSTTNSATPAASTPAVSATECSSTVASATVASVAADQNPQAGTCAHELYGNTTAACSHCEPSAGLRSSDSASLAAAVADASGANIVSPPQSPVPAGAQLRRQWMESVSP
jgi:serine/threonine protein kinase